MPLNGFDEIVKMQQCVFCRFAAAEETLMIGGIVHGMFDTLPVSGDAGGRCARGATRAGLRRLGS